jgi:hypothetical protein
MISRSDSRGLVVRLGSVVLASGMTIRNSDTGLVEPLITSGKRHGASNLDSSWREEVHLEVLGKGAWNTFQLARSNF